MSDWSKITQPGMGRVQRSYLQSQSPFWLHNNAVKSLPIWDLITLTFVSVTAVELWPRTQGLSELGCDFSRAS